MRTIRLDTPDGELRMEAVVLDPEADVADELIPLDQFENSVGTLTHVATAIRQKVSALSPNKVSLELGLAVGIESGKLTSLIVKGTGNATIKVTLEWTKNPS